MDRITEVTEEFYGNSSSKKPFNSLEKLEFEDMLEWKQWHVLGSGEFPILEKLAIGNCPKLMGKLPENLCSLTELGISECPELNLDTSQLEGMKQIEGLYIIDCNSLTSLPFSILPSTLKRIRISGCQKLKLEAPVGEMSYCNMFLEYLKLEKCYFISPELLPRARKLNVYNCQNLTRFLIPTATDSLTIENCENLEKLSVTLPSAMTYLCIEKCEKLKRLPDHMQELLPSLKKLILENCPEIESGGLPFNLQKLQIRNCTKLVNGRKEWRLPRLGDLVIEHDGSDESEMEHWELPSSITSLTIHNMKTLSSQVIKSLTSLEYLYVADLPQIQSLLEEGLPSSLSELFLSRHHELHSLGLSHLTSLQSLTITTCPNIQSLPESALPSSLSQLTIQNCHNLQSLSESALPSSLSHLTIYNCPKLQSLPVKGMASSLSNLYIRNCPLLSPLLEFDKGEYWPNIAQIPTIVINEEFP